MFSTSPHSSLSIFGGNNCAQLHALSINIYLAAGGNSHVGDTARWQTTADEQQSAQVLLLHWVRSETQSERS